MQSQTINGQFNSREYKMILNPVEFSDESEGRKKVIDIIKSQIEKQKGTFEEDVFDREEKNVWYVDTEKHALYRINNFIVRVKEETTDNVKKYDVTFKNRDKDRVRAASHELSKPVLKPGSTLKDHKFEEDILTLSDRKFSAQAKIEYNQMPDLKTYQDILSIYPDLQLDISPYEILSKVNDFAATEISYDLGKLIFKNGKKAKVQISLWYSLKDNGRKSIDSIETPLIGEFDIDVKAEALTGADGSISEEFPDSIMADIDEFYGALQQKDIADKGANKTKTQYAYDY